MFDANIEQIESDHTTKYRITCDGLLLSFAQVLGLWRADSSFREYFTILLADSPFSAYRWETPALSRLTVDRPFEFVLRNSPSFCSRETDAKPFHDYFTDDDTDQGIVTFANLSGDTTLFVPSPRTDKKSYGHLAAFIRLAPKSQVDAFWRIIGTTVENQVNDNPLWLSTAGGGVAWLHVRLASRPKYYGYSPYRQLA